MLDGGGTGQSEDADGEQCSEDRVSYEGRQVEVRLEHRGEDRVGGRHQSTPRVSAAARSGSMPRRNRYAAPSRSRSGS